ncbi:MAG: peptidylprolyl isomerase [Bacteroidota bacterium]|nr:peptidylprolyl isomerase [Bacteroidota bacterium]
MKKLFIITVILVYNSTYAQNKSKRDYVVTIQTKLGNINLILFDETPKHKENFIKLAQSKFYDSTTFHRIIKNFMIQGGDPNSKDNDPNNDGLGGPGYTIPAEFNPKFLHDKGALAAARMGDQVNPNKESSGSQFYIVENAAGTHFLDNNYTVFGKVIKGIDVVENIANQAKDQRDRPIENINMTIKVEYLKKKKIKKRYGYEYPKL